MFVMESAFADIEYRIHTPEDLPKYLDYDHMVDHAEISLGFIYELAFAQL